MKTAKIIKKNIKLLMRSKTSSLVLVFGPLLVILLVGLSFNTNTFLLKIGVFSDSYSELSNSFVDKLSSEGYGILKYTTEIQCIDSVKEGLTHACIIFPGDMAIDNNKENTIKFYVDQSKINLVYLVKSTLTSSFEEKNTEISQELTEDIINSLLETRENTGEIISAIIDLKSMQDNIAKDTQASLGSLNSIDLEIESVDANSTLSKLKTDIEKLADEGIVLAEDSLELMVDLDDWVMPNGTSYFNSLEDNLIELNDSLSTNQNLTLKDFSAALSKLDSEYKAISEKLESAKTVNSGVSSKLSAIGKNIATLKEKTSAIEMSATQIVADIDSIKITKSDRIVTPIKTEINQVVKSDSNLGFLFPSLIVMLIMFLGLVLPSTIVIIDKNSKAFFRVFTTPTKNWLFIVSTYLTSMLLIFFQLFIVFFVSSIFFKINLLGSFFLLVVSLLIIMTFFIVLGMLIGYLFNTEEMAMLGSVSLGLLFLLTSGIIFPMESMPSYILDKARLNPVVLGSEMFKRSILLNTGFSSIQAPAISLILFSLLVIGLIILIKKSKSIMALIKKPTKQKVRRAYFESLFDFGERKAHSLPEFIVSVQNLSDDRFNSLMKQSAFSNWIILVYKDKKLGEKLESITVKQDLIASLVEELKRITGKK